MLYHTLALSHKMIPPLLMNLQQQTIKSMSFLQLWHALSPEVEKKTTREENDTPNSSNIKTNPKTNKPNLPPCSNVPTPNSFYSPSRSNKTTFHQSNFQAAYNIPQYPTKPNIPNKLFLSIRTTMYANQTCYTSSTNPTILKTHST